jgi:L-alanine-DL-glutamate epimerase-like enolase superfamily enzyme
MSCEDGLIVEPIQTADGRARMPQKPDLGVKVDVDAPETYRVA